VQKEGSAGSLSREVALERELNEATEKINKLKAEKEQLDASVVELQRRLTEFETKAPSARRQSVMSIIDGSVHSRDSGGGGLGSNASSMEAALRRGEREKQMEMLVRLLDKECSIHARIMLSCNLHIQ
jgi:hypothetical protein